MTGSIGGELRMADMTTGAQDRSSGVRNKDVRSLAFSADRNRLAVVTSVRDKPDGADSR